MGSSTGSLFGANGANPVESMIERLRYINERESRKIYHSKGLHVAFLELVFSLLLTTNHTLEPLYVDQFPLNNKKMNIPFILHLHVNHPSNEEVISELLAHTHTTSSPYFRLLKLLCVRLFNPDMYTGLTRIGKGAFGVVYKGIWRDERELIHIQRLEGMVGREEKTKNKLQKGNMEALAMIYLP
eukprot:TRINITY_DN8444_c0_g1_i1.p1 TRINITY_DN8444_c0_g1~~TRINITY_DN8444_c0_g1_i1.p1  ORF type:complete len:216 (-),score=52.68 TRINITY_DN8444_c0_g1_i1:189-743(-)